MDVYAARWTIAASPLVCIFFTFLYIYFMDKCAYWLAWISVAVIELTFLGLGTGCLIAMLNMSEGEKVTYSSTYTTLQWTTWTSYIAAALYALVVCCAFKSLKVAIAVIETAADYFSDTKRVVLVPVLFFFLTIVVFLGWIVAMICVASIGEISVEGVAYETQVKTIENPEFVGWMYFYMTFGIFWIIAFIMALNEFIIIVSAVTWYYSDKTIEDDDGIPGDSDVKYGFIWAFKYHFGSLALGSLLVAIVWMIRLVFEYAAKKMETASGENGCVKCLIGCMRCCLACFDRFLRYINRNAYIYMSVSSESFCNSAMNVFILMLKNSAKFGFVDGIADVFMFLAKFLISALSTFVAYWLLQWMTDVQSVYLPLGCIFVLVYMIASIFMSIFDTGSNTILVCYILDKEIQNAGGLPEATHIPPTMTKFFGQQEIQTLMDKNDDPKSESRQNLLQ
jgi:hypothetical protein